MSRRAEGGYLHRITGQVTAVLVLVAIWLLPGVGSAAAAAPPPTPATLSISAEPVSIVRGAAGILILILNLTNLTSAPVTGIYWSVDLQMPTEADKQPGH